LYFLINSLGREAVSPMTKLIFFINRASEGSEDGKEDLSSLTIIEF